MYQYRFKKGDKVGFVYKNSVGKTVYGYGVIKWYKKGFYGVSIGDDMPDIPIYCNRIHLAGRDIEPAPVKIHEKLFCDVVAFNFKRFVTRMNWIILGTGLALIVIALLK